jgi:hypothetical protein
VRSNCVASLENYSDRTRVPNPQGSTRSSQALCYRRRPARHRRSDSGRRLCGDGTGVELREPQRPERCHVPVSATGTQKPSASLRPSPRQQQCVAEIRANTLPVASSAHLLTKRGLASARAEPVSRLAAQPSTTRGVHHISAHGASRSRAWRGAGRWFGGNWDGELIRGQEEADVRTSGGGGAVTLSAQTQRTISGVTVPTLVCFPSTPHRSEASISLGCRRRIRGAIACRTV